MARHTKNCGDAENVGKEDAAQNYMSGKCRKGKCSTTLQRWKMRERKCIT